MNPKENKIKKIISNEVTLVIAVIGVAWGAFNYLNDPHVKITEDVAKIHTDIALIQQSILTIQTNHEEHMQEALEEIKQLKEDDVKLDQQLSKQNEAIIKLLTIHPELK
jgi:predicted RecB family endonuclease